MSDTHEGGDADVTFDVPAGISRVWATIDRETGEGFGESPRRTLRVAVRSGTMWRWGAWSAGLAAAAALVLVVISHAHVRIRQFATAPGEQMHVTLSDGTGVLLAPGSRVNVASGYASGARDVTLEGEAYFSVVHNDRHPFAVLANNITITDVGTEFDVRAYDPNVRVAVAQGNVLVGAGRGNGAMGWPGRSIDAGTVSRPRPTSPTQKLPSFQDIPLSAGDMIDVANGVPTLTHHANLAAITVWQEGGLVFQNTPLREVVRDIARTYDVEITVADSTLLDQPITASFSHRPVELILEALTQAVGARYERSGKHVVIRMGLADTLRSGHAPPLPLATAQANK